MTQPADNLKLKEETPVAPRDGRQLQSSPHLLDLKARPLSDEEAALVPEAADRLERPRTVARRAAWQRLLDERIHLKELRHPTLSERPRGWRDFPDPAAKTVSHAVAILIVRFFREHPLADLTVLTLLHLTVAVAARTLIWPITYYRRQRALERQREQVRLAMPAIPFAGIQAELAGQDQTRQVQSQPRVKRQAKTPGFFAWQPLPAWRGRVAAFAVASLVMALGLAVGPQAWTLGKYGIRQASLAAQSGAARLLMAGEAAAAGDIAGAQGAFDSASDDFSIAKSGLGGLGMALAKGAALLPVDSPLTAAGPLIISGDELAKAGSILAGSLAAFGSDGQPLDKLDNFREALNQALPHLETASRQVARVRLEALPEEYRQPVSLLQDNLPALTEDTRRAIQATGLLHWALGDEATRRYLIVFENDAELRPTGGFIGSYAIIDVDRGQVTKMEVPGGGSYDLQGSLLARLVSPQPLHLINPNWEFQDANWFADFPTSAAKLAWFLDKAKGPSVDGVIALTSAMMEDVLQATGPIEMPEYNKVIDYRNFWFETQRQVEIDYDKDSNRPKQFIADMAPKLIDRIVKADRPTLTRLASVLDDALARKEALLWFRDEQAEQQAMELDWAGQVKPSPGDYLAVVHTNIAGQKTDRMMRDKIDHSVQVMTDGSATVTLTLERTHTGLKGAMFSGVRNVDFARFYVPYGAQLIEAKGFEAPDPKLFEIPDPGRTADPDVAASEAGLTVDRYSGVRTFTESGKTVFGGWLQTDPGQTTVATLVYRLPPGTVRTAVNDGGLSGALGRLLGGSQPGEQTASYSLLIQKQPGAVPAEFTSRVDLPPGFRPIWQEPDRQEDDRGRWQYGFQLDRDTVLKSVATAPGQSR